MSVPLSVLQLDYWVFYSIMGQQMFNVYTPTYLTIPQIFTWARGTLAASAHEVGTIQVRILIGCVFVEIVTESETCHICRAVLLSI
jgi:hypothetical protein